MRWRTAGDTEAGGVAPLAYVAAALVAAFGFAFRLLSLRGLPNDHYVYLSAAQQILLGDVPGRDFVEPGMFLQFLISAAGQAVAPGPATEGVLTITMLAVAAMVTCVAIAWLTRSVLAGTLAALFQILIYPRLYSFPKVLVPAVLLLLCLMYARRPRTPMLLLMAGWIAVAFLLRHDIGAYAALGGAVAVALSQRTVKDGVRAWVYLTGAVLAILLPYVLYLEWSGGIVEHVRGAFEYGKSEQGGFHFDWPVIRFITADEDSRIPWGRDDAAAFLFYCAYSLPVISALLLGRAEYRRNPMIRSAVGGAVVVAICYDAIILRHPIVSRVPDLAAILAILGAWSAVALIGTAQSRKRVGMLALRVASQGLVVALVIITAVSVYVLSELRSEFAEASLLKPPAVLKAHADRVIAAGRDWPWREFWPSGSPPDAIEYVNACTNPNDRIFLTWPAPEYFVFTRRGFGGGHPNFLAPHSFKSIPDQDLVNARLDSHHVPMVLINESTRHEFSEAYPRIDQYVRRLYTPSGEFTIRDGSTISIAIRHGLTPEGRYGPDNWPCLVSKP